LPRPVSITSHSRNGSAGEAIRSTSAPCAASVRPHTGPATIRVRSSHANSREWRAPGASGRGAASPIRSIVKSGSEARRARLRVRAPLLGAAHHGNHGAGLVRRRLEVLALPAGERRADRLARVGAAEQSDDAAAVVREVRVRRTKRPSPVRYTPAIGPTWAAGSFPAIRR